MSGKSWSGGLATFLEFFDRNVNFWLCFIHSNVNIILFPGKVKYVRWLGLGFGASLWIYRGRKSGQRYAHFSKKNEKVKKIVFSNFWQVFSINLQKNRLILNNFFVRVTRRAGWLILGSKSNTVSGKSRSGGLATFLEFFNRNVNFWLCSIHSNVDIILFPGKVKYVRWHGLGSGSDLWIYRGRNSEKRYAQLKKKWKSEKSFFLLFYEVFAMNLQKIYLIW